MCLAVTQLGAYAVEYPGYGHASRGVSEPSEEAMYTTAELMLEHLTKPTENGGTPGYLQPFGKIIIIINNGSISMI